MARDGSAGDILRPFCCFPWRFTGYLRGADGGFWLGVFEAEAAGRAGTPGQLPYQVGPSIETRELWRRRRPVRGSFSALASAGRGVVSQAGVH